MFIDASALVAILLEEDDGLKLSESIDDVPIRLTSPIAVYETVTAVARVQGGGIALAALKVRQFLERAEISVLPVEDQSATAALDAYARYGRGQGHPARLNMGDCFAYGMAKQHGLPLLYKGDDLARTDLA